MAYTNYINYTMSLHSQKNNQRKKIVSFSEGEETNSDHLQPTTESTALFSTQNRYQQPQTSLLQSNILSTIGQPYSGELCNYGPVYHPHNILHNYNPVYSNEKTMRSTNFARPVYGNYTGFYGNNNFRSPTLHQNGYDFTPR